VSVHVRPVMGIVRAVVIVLCVGVCVAAAVTPAQAVVNGDVVPGGNYNDPIPATNEYAFVGRVASSTDGLCTASLVSPDYILTAGHCNDGGRLTITFGMLNKDRDRSATFAQNRTVVETQLFHDSLRDGQDLLLGKLDSPVFGIAPIRMPDPARDANMWSSNSRLTLAGWGSIGSVNTAELRIATLKVADDAVSLPPWTGLMKLNHVQGYGAGGDSGGPVFGRSADGYPILVGVYEAAIGPGHMYANRVWIETPLIEYLNSVQYVATPSP